MKIVLTGGGTGGHITPLLAVAQKLKALQPDIELIYIGETGSKFADLTKGSELFDQQYTIRAGKFRRYHGESWLRRIVDVKTNIQNIRDGIYVLRGIAQSKRILGRIKPDVVLLKGGFVGVPVGIAAGKKHIPIVTHDSDALPGLANRLVSKWVTYHATGMPVEFYSYPPQTTRYVGVLVGEQFTPVTTEVQNQYKQALGLSTNVQVLTVTGGSLGAQRLNQAMIPVAPQLLEHYPNLHIFHQVGKGNEATYGSYQHERLHVLEFLQHMEQYTGAAEVVVTRAGANTLAELGVQGKACIVVPNPLLTGGHQLKNAEHLAAAGTVITVSEESIKDASNTSLHDAIIRLLEDSATRNALGKKLQGITIPNAAESLAKLLVEVANTKEKNASA